MAACCFEGHEQKLKIAENYTYLTFETLLYEEYVIKHSKPELNIFGKAKKSSDYSLILKKELIALKNYFPYLELKERKIVFTKNQLLICLDWSNDILQFIFCEKRVSRIENYIEYSKEDFLEILDYVLRSKN